MKNRKEPKREPVYGVAFTDVEIRLLLAALDGREGPARLDDIRGMLETAVPVNTVAALVRDE